MGYFCFLFLETQPVSSTSDNDENIWISTFCDVFVMGFWKETEIFFSGPFSLRNSFEEVGCLAQGYSGVNGRGRFRTQPVLFRLQHATQFPVITRGSSSPWPEFSLALGAVLCLISFQSAVRVQQPSQNIFISSFLCLLAAAFSLLLCHNISGPLQYSLKGDTQR